MTPLLILYGSQTGNAQARSKAVLLRLLGSSAGLRPSRSGPAATRGAARVHAPPSTPDPRAAAAAAAAQDVAEAVAREARLRLFEPRVLAMDAYPVLGLPSEPAVVFVASTTGQVRARGTMWLVCFYSAVQTHGGCAALCGRQSLVSLSELNALRSLSFGMPSDRRLARIYCAGWPRRRPQGDAPDNMRRFWRFLLRKSLAVDSLTAVRYAVFGLGDSGYVKFNVRRGGLLSCS